MGNTTTNREYYNAFAARYEQERGGKRPGGYHDLVDRLEAQFVEQFGTGGNILEVGCGTGLVLERLKQFGAHVQGIDLSPQMLKKAEARGLQVRVGDATDLPFEDNHFDVVCAFKVLAHVEDLASALSEMVRVVKPGGYILAEFYNLWSLRAAVKRAFPPEKVSTHLNESQVFTRYDSPRQIRRNLPANCHFIRARGIRILIPSASVMNIPVVGTFFSRAENALCDSPAAIFGGFWVAALRKSHPA